MSAISLPGHAATQSQPAASAGTPSASVASKPEGSKSEMATPTSQSQQDGGVVASFKDGTAPATAAGSGSTSQSYDSGSSISPAGYQPGSTGGNSGYPGAGKGIIR